MLIWQWQGDMNVINGHLDVQTLFALSGKILDLMFLCFSLLIDRKHQLF